MEFGGIADPSVSYSVQAPGLLACHRGILATSHCFIKAQVIETSKQSIILRVPSWCPPTIPPAAIPRCSPSALSPPSTASTTTPPRSTPPAPSKPWLQHLLPAQVWQVPLQVWRGVVVRAVPGAPRAVRGVPRGGAGAVRVVPGVRARRARAAHPAVDGRQGHLPRGLRTQVPVQLARAYTYT